MSARGPATQANETARHSWVGAQWRAILERHIPAARLREGWAIDGRPAAVKLTIRPGEIEAVVAAGSGRSVTARWRVGAFSDAQWQRVVEAMADQAFYPAKLLANELPAGLEALLGSLDLHLVPQESEVAAECTCGEPGPCKHAAAAGCRWAARLDEEPLAALALRGMPVERLLEQVSAARTLRSGGVSAAHTDPLSGEAEPAEPLESLVEDFWRPGPGLGELERMEPPRHAPHALLRRLGPSPLPGRFPLVGLLASVYDRVAEAAVRLRDRAERL